jgi:23S rRNA (uracil1939-C5)-methyltransferase
VGLFSLLLGSQENPILGIDSFPQAIADAHTNAQSRGFSQAEFICRDIQTYSPEADIYPGDLLIFDPPRKGCPTQVLERAVRSEADSVLMVSCFLETQMRDIQYLQRRGFDLIFLSAYDMFPFTDFLETAVLLRKK